MLMSKNICLELRPKADSDLDATCIWSVATYCTSVCSGLGQAPTAVLPDLPGTPFAELAYTAPSVESSREMRQ